MGACMPEPPARTLRERSELDDDGPTRPWRAPTRDEGPAWTQPKTGGERTRAYDLHQVQALLERLGRRPQAAQAGPTGPTTPAAGTHDQAVPWELAAAATPSTPQPGPKRVSLEPNPRLPPSHCPPALPADARPSHRTAADQSTPALRDKARPVRPDTARSRRRGVRSRSPHGSSSERVAERAHADERDDLAQAPPNTHTGHPAPEVHDPGATRVECAPSHPPATRARDQNHPSHTPFWMLQPHTRLVATALVTVAVCAAAWMSAGAEAPNATEASATIAGPARAPQATPHLIAGEPPAPTETRARPQARWAEPGRARPTRVLHGKRAQADSRVMDRVGEEEPQVRQAVNALVAADLPTALARYRALAAQPGADEAFAAVAQLLARRVQLKDETGGQP